MTDLRTRGASLFNIFWLVLVWVMLWGSVTWANLLSGLLVALLITVLVPLPRVPVEGRVRPLSLLLLIVHLSWSLVVSSAQLMWFTIRPSGAPDSGILRAPLNLKSDFVFALAVDAINLVPGTVAVEIDQRKRLVYVHVLDVSSDKAIAAFYHDIARYETLFRNAFERPEDWKPSPHHDTAYSQEEAL